MLDDYILHHLHRSTSRERLILYRFRQLLPHTDHVTLLIKYSILV